MRGGRGGRLLSVGGGKTGSQSLSWGFPCLSHHHVAPGHKASSGRCGDGRFSPCSSRAVSVWVLDKLPGAAFSQTPLRTPGGSYVPPFQSSPGASLAGTDHSGNPKVLNCPPPPAPAPAPAPCTNAYFLLRVPSCVLPASGPQPLRVKPLLSSSPLPAASLATGYRKRLLLLLLWLYAQFPLIPG